MSNSLWLRINANNEKQYIEKLGRFFSGILFRGNFFESSPGMCSSLAIAMASPNSRTTFAIDPVTYVFSLNPTSDWSIRHWRKVTREKAKGALRSDLMLQTNEPIAPGWVREIQHPGKRDKDKVEIFGIRKAYRELATKTFAGIDFKIGREPIGLDQLRRNGIIERLVESTIRYQRTAVASRFQGKKFQGLERAIPGPGLIFSPYFPIDSKDWLSIHQRIWEEFDKQVPDTSRIIVVTCSAKFLRENFAVITSAISRSSAQNVAIWLDGFEEETAGLDDLVCFRNFIRSVRDMDKECLNLFGGGFTSCLFQFGVSCVLSCGYGESKAIEPLSGGFPTAKFYLPARLLRRPVGDIFDLIKRANKGKTKRDYGQEICNCAICKDELDLDLSRFVEFFGELGDPKPFGDGTRRFPTGRAMERCKFQYLLSRMREFRQMQYASVAESIAKLNTTVESWSSVSASFAHLQTWRDALASE